MTMASTTSTTVLYQLINIFTYDGTMVAFVYYAQLSCKAIFLRSQHTNYHLSRLSILLGVSLLRDANFRVRSFKYEFIPSWELHRSLHPCERTIPQKWCSKLSFGAT